ncbi:MAG: carboxypeptidase regulatory-like domain-containing protein [Planctomycetes bacterium]|nr:carboxypeptidase regulatory-like domain-containing protein [Planctomycetota bacterium]
MPCVVATILLATVATLLWLGGSDAEAPPAVRPHTDPAAGSGWDTLVDVSPGPSTPPRPIPADVRRVPVATSGVFGVVLDDRGQPLPGLRVEWRGVDGGWLDQMSVRSDSDGRFAFPRATGEFSLHVDSDVPIDTHLESAGDERREVVLRATTPCVLVHGRVTKHGRPVPRRSIRVLSPDALASADGRRTTTDDDGVFALLLPPGEHRLYVTTPQPEPNWSRPPHATLQLTAAEPRVNQDLALSGVGVVAMVTCDGVPVAGEPVVLCATRTTAPPITAKSDGDGYAVFDDLTAGHYELASQSAFYRPPPPRLVFAADPAPVVPLQLIPGGQLRVRFESSDGLPVSELAPECATFEIAGITLRPELHRYNGLPGTGLLFTNTPAGEGILRSQDWLADGRRHFAPFEPVVIAFSVAPGRFTPVRAFVDRRPLLRVRPVDAAGHGITAEVLVFAGGELLGSTTQPGFAARVPRGSYRVQVKRGDHHQEEEVLVSGDLDLPIVVQ